MTRRVALAVVAALAFGASLLAFTAGAGAASGVVAVGWWSRNPAASAPAGGMAVGIVPDGPATVAAVKVDVGDGVATATLELAEAGGTAMDVASVLACETSTTWQPVERGDIAAAPATVCAEGRSVVLARDAGSLVWSADVSTLLAGRTGLASIALVPVQADGVGSLAYEVQWSGPPTFTSTSAPAAAPSTGATTVTTRAAAAPTPVSVAPPASSTRPAAALQLPALSTPVVVAAPASPLAQATTETAPPTTQLVAQAPTAPPSSAGEYDPPVEQAVFFVVVSAIAGTLAGVGRWFVTSR